MNASLFVRRIALFIWTKTPNWIGYPVVIVVGGGVVCFSIGLFISTLVKAFVFGFKLLW